MIVRFNPISKYILASFESGLDGWMQIGDRIETDAQVTDGYLAFTSADMNVVQSIQIEICLGQLTCDRLIAIETVGSGMQESHLTCSLLERQSVREEIIDVTATVKRT